MIKTIESTNIKDVVQKIQSSNIPDGSSIHITIKTEEPKKEKKLSKWEQMLQEADSIDISDDTYEHIKRSSKEFREEFAFKHDLIE
jgi:hypothetical protein